MITMRIKKFHDGENTIIQVQITDNNYSRYQFHGHTNPVPNIQNICENDPYCLDYLPRQNHKGIYGQNSHQSHGTDQDPNYRSIHKHHFYHKFLLINGNFNNEKGWKICITTVSRLTVAGTLVVARGMHRCNKHRRNENLHHHESLSKSRASVIGDAYLSPCCWDLCLVLPQFSEQII